MLRIFFMFIVLIHGLIHLLGFVKGYRLADVSQLSQDISRPAGFLWLLATMLFLAVVFLFFLQRTSWWMVAVPAMFISQVLIVMTWQDAKFGTVANVIIFIVTIVGYGGWSFRSMIDRELPAFLASSTSPVEMVTREHIATLPPVVQRWLERSNVIGSPRTRTVHLFQKGAMRTSPDGNWMPFEAEQWFRTENPGFFWTADVAMAPGINILGRDRYQDGHGKMLIKALGLIPVVDASGREIDQGSMLRFLAEIAWFPSSALDPYIQWEQIDSLRAKAAITIGGITDCGTFSFDESGDLLTFEAMRYYERKEGPSLEHWFIRNAPDGFKEFQGIRIPTKSTVTWKLKEGDYTWLSLEVLSIAYNTNIIK